MLGGGGILEQLSAVFGGGGTAEEDPSAVFGGGGTIEQDGSAVTGGGGIAEQDGKAVTGGGGIAEQPGSAVTGGGGIIEQDGSAVTGGGGIAEQDGSAVTGGGGITDPPSPGDTIAAERSGLSAPGHEYFRTSVNASPSASPESSAIHASDPIPLMVRPPARFRNPPFPGYPPPPTPHQLATPASASPVSHPASGLASSDASTNKVDPHYPVDLYSPGVSDPPDSANPPRYLVGVMLNITNDARDVHECRRWRGGAALVTQNVAVRYPQAGRGSR